jgi:hypothetical protein
VGGLLAANRLLQAAWIAALAARAFDDFLTRPGGDWRATHLAELDNAPAAFAWVFDIAGDAVAAAIIMTGFGEVWTTNLLVSECRQRTQAVLAKLDRDANPTL